MKKILSLLLFLVTCGAFAQTTYFFDKKGKKTVMRDDTVDIIVVDERLTYAEDGKDWEKYIRFKDLDYAVIGPMLFKSFKLTTAKGKTKKETAYFVITESEEKKLLCYTYTVVGKYTSIDYYNIYFVDNNNQILDYIEFNTSNIFIGARAKITPFMNKHFSNCETVMNRFNEFEDNDDKHLNILGFFSKPYHLKCN
ncbi:MAG TPA: hypothetical protein VLB74_05965 [Flavobacterium sp.]|uniref:hypothetical protein n=1 Tax=Flavobacterium sp. TaxID=239 RepID=UPI002CE66EF2|nr:hypothetical protein [Flavobacterium sp.]HSD14173.1 hypothetical protein [Flavobacterium sp.]